MILIWFDQIQIDFCVSICAKISISIYDFYLFIEICLSGLGSPSIIINYYHEFSSIERYYVHFTPKCITKLLHKKKSIKRTMTPNNFKHLQSIRFVLNHLSFPIPIPQKINFEFRVLQINSISLISIQQNSLKFSHDLSAHWRSEAFVCDLWCVVWHHQNSIWIHTSM